MSGIIIFLLSVGPHNCSLGHQEGRHRHRDLHRCCRRSIRSRRLAAVLLRRRSRWLHIRRLLLLGCRCRLLLLLLLLRCACISRCHLARLASSHLSLLARWIHIHRCCLSRRLLLVGCGGFRVLVCSSTEVGCVCSRPEVFRHTSSSGHACTRRKCTSHMQRRTLISHTRIRTCGGCLLAAAAPAAPAAAPTPAPHFGPGLPIICRLAAMPAGGVQNREV